MLFRSAPLVAGIQESLRVPSRFLFQRRVGRLIVNPIYKSRDTRRGEKNVFVIMPFSENWSDRIWQRIVLPLLREEGYNAKRADDLYGRDIMEDI